MSCADGYQMTMLSEDCWNGEVFYYTCSTPDPVYVGPVETMCPDELTLCDDRCRADLEALMDAEGAGVEDAMRAQDTPLAEVLACKCLTRPSTCSAPACQWKTTAARSASVPRPWPAAAESE